MKIRSKIFLFTLLASVVIFAGAFGYIAFNQRSKAIARANNEIILNTKNASGNLKKFLNSELRVCETLAHSFTDYNELPSKYRENLYKDVLINVLNSHPEYISAWISLELRFLDLNYHRNYGRKVISAVRKAGLVSIFTDTLDLYGDNFGSKYYETKMMGTDIFLPPDYYRYSYDIKDSILSTGIGKPIIIDAEFAGAVGINLSMPLLDEIVFESKPNEESEAILLSNSGHIISSALDVKTGDSITHIYPELAQFDIYNKIKDGHNLKFHFNDSTGNSYLTVVEPVKIGNSNSPWSLCVVTPSSAILSSNDSSSFKNNIIIGAIALVLFSLILFILVGAFTINLKKTVRLLKRIDKGDIDDDLKIKINTKDEIGQMATFINNFIDILSNTIKFANKIGEGDFNSQYKSSGKNDVLGKALTSMQTNLQVRQEQEEIRQLERRKLNWTQDGLTELSEVLRTSTDDFEEYLLTILSYILKYIKADQGAIFLLNTIDALHPFLELRSAYAYDKKKSLETKLEIGESLVGRCFQEKETIYMTNIPEGYTFVSSGLGSHEPRCLFLMPLLFEDEPFGVIEIASFRELAEFEIEFLKTIGERVASSISVMEKNVQTKELLEQYQVQSMELQNRENMLKENLQELQKMQEDAAAHEKEKEDIIEALSNLGSITWYNMQGKIKKVKDINLEKLGYTEQDLVGKYHRQFAIEAKEAPNEYAKFWEDLRKGQSQKRINSQETSEGKIWITELYTPIKDTSGNYVQVINIGFEITQQKILEQKVKELKTKLSKSAN